MYIRNKDITMHPFEDDTEESIGCIVRDSRGYLLLVYGKEKISFPKGHRKRGETPEECAIREVLEETGIDVSEYVHGKCRWLVRAKYFYVQLPKRHFEYTLSPAEEEISKPFWVRPDTFMEKLIPKRCNRDVRSYRTIVYKSATVTSTNAD